MPERKGRKRRSGRRGEGASPATAAAAPQRNASPRRADPLVPSNTARATGLMIGVITAFLAILMISDAATGASGGVNELFRIAVGALLVLLAAVVSALSVFPAQIRRRLRGK